MPNAEVFSFGIQPSATRIIFHSAFDIPISALKVFFHSNFNLSYRDHLILQHPKNSIRFLMADGYPPGKPAK